MYTENLYISHKYAINVCILYLYGEELATISEFW